MCQALDRHGSHFKYFRQRGGHLHSFAFDQNTCMLRSLAGEVAKPGGRLSLLNGVASKPDASQPEGRGASATALVTEGASVPVAEGWRVSSWDVALWLDLVEMLWKRLANGGPVSLSSLGTLMPWDARKYADVSNLAPPLPHVNRESRRIVYIMACSVVGCSLKLTYTVSPLLTLSHASHLVTSPLCH